MNSIYYRLLLATILHAAILNAQAVLFMTGPSRTVIVGNDGEIGPKNRYYSRELRAKNDSQFSQYEVSFAIYDLTALKPAGKVYTNCSLRACVKGAYPANVGKYLYIYAVKETLDHTLPVSWKTSPGLMNDPTPALNSEITLATLDMGKIYPLVGSCKITSTDWLWYQTADSFTLTDILNQDTNNTLMLMFITYDPESNFQIRSRGDNTVDPKTGLSNGPVLIGEISDPISAGNPSPASGSTISTNLSQVRWSVPAPVSAIPVVYNVYPNYYEADYGYMTLARSMVNTFAPLPSGLLLKNTAYYWIVDVVAQSRTTWLTRGCQWILYTTNTTSSTNSGGKQYILFCNAAEPLKFVNKRDRKLSEAFDYTINKFAPCVGAKKLSLFYYGGVS
ncbi:MAG TPA: hypothetical protein PKB02_06515 [Anaerohalosphaeraceae bacterium]|nr:hypothetical protein [Anaerohalosphaeraceae bacterium]